MPSGPIHPLVTPDGDGPVTTAAGLLPASSNSGSMADEEIIDSAEPVGPAGVSAKSPPTAPNESSQLPVIQQPPLQDRAPSTDFTAIHPGPPECMQITAAAGDSTRPSLEARRIQLLSAVCLLPGAAPEVAALGTRVAELFGFPDFAAVRK